MRDFVAISHAEAALAKTVLERERMNLRARGLAENLPILSNDSVFDTYKLRRLWD